MTKRQCIRHSSVFGLFFLYCILFYVQPAEKKLENYIYFRFPDANIPDAFQYFDVDPLEIHGWIFVEGLALSLLIYGFYILYHVKRFSQNLMSKHDLWRYLLSSILILDGILLLMADGGVIEDYHLYDPILPEFMTRVFSSVTLYILSIFLLFNNKVLEPEKKYQNSILSPKLRKAMMNKILHAFDTDQVFTSPDFSLAQLSSHTGISENHISEVLNTEQGMTFYNITHKFRIELATRLLSSNNEAKQNMTHLAKSIGYKSKSTFYNAFKREHDITPLEYKKILRQ